MEIIVFMQKIFDFIYVSIFGRYTLDGFVSEKAESVKYNYIFDSVFPNEEIMKIALSPQKTVSSSSAILK